MTLQEHADRVNLHLEKAAASVIAAGRALIEIKATVPHGEWARLFQGASHAVARPIRVSLGTAERLMKIAAHPVLSKSAHVPILPAAWGTLYELTKLPEEELTRALADGRITPGMEREEVLALRAAPVEPTEDQRAEPTAEQRADPQWWAHRINQFAHKAAEAQRRTARMYLAYADDLARADLPPLFAGPMNDLPLRKRQRAIRRLAGDMLAQAEEFAPSSLDALQEEDRDS